MKSKRVENNKKASCRPTPNHWHKMDHKQRRGKIIRKGRLPTNNRITNAVRMAAGTLRLSHSYLGAQFRRLRSKLGAPVAIKAMAAKLARLVYRMLRYGMPFIDPGEAFYESQHRKLPN